MRIAIVFCAFVLFSCSKKTATDAKTIETIPTNTAATKKVTVDSIDGKPIKSYIENKNCDSVAIAFYYGKYHPSDEEKTDKLLALATSDDENLRPFYRWILDQTIIISDGALAEHIGIPARKYAEKFPVAFFKFVDSDVTKSRYDNWVDAISYSGYYDSEDYRNPKLIREHLFTAMVKNSAENYTDRIHTFALDCFPNKSNLD